MIRAAKREHALLGARFLFVSPGAPQSQIEAILIERLAQRLRLHHVGMELRPAGDRIDAAREAVAVDVRDQLEAEFVDAGIAERDHLAEFPGGVDVQERKRRLSRIERFQRKMQQDEESLPIE